MIGVKGVDLNDRASTTLPPHLSPIFTPKQLQAPLPLLWSRPKDYSGKGTTSKTPITTPYVIIITQIV